MYMHTRQVSVEELGQEAKRLAAVMKDRQAELQSLTQQVSERLASWQVVSCTCTFIYIMYIHNVYTPYLKKVVELSVLMIRTCT